MRQVRVTPMGHFLVLSFRESHFGKRPYFYKTGNINEATLFDKHFGRTHIHEELDKDDKSIFRETVPISARVERKVFLVNDEKEIEK